MPTEADLPSQATQVSKQLLGLYGDREVESFLDSPSVVERIRPLKPPFAVELPAW